jgi:hypothetical protein
MIGVFTDASVYEIFLIASKLAARGFSLNVITDPPSLINIRLCPIYKTILLSGFKV